MILNLVALQIRYYLVEALKINGDWRGQDEASKINGDWRGQDEAL